MNNKVVAYFDFDGTLTRCDTLFSFLIHCAGPCRFILKLPLILPIFSLSIIKVINNATAKEKILNILFKGKKEHYIEKKAKSFAEDKIDKFIKPEVFAKLEYHHEHNHKIIIISANLAVYLRYWASRHQISSVIATELSFQDGRFTGQLATPNCYGREKVCRLEKYLNESKEKFSYSYAYGDSRGDYELLDFVDEGYWISGDVITPWKKDYENTRCN